MPSFSSSGIATSARHVVGLHEPPRKTSGASRISLFSCFWSSFNCCSTFFLYRSVLFGESEVIWNGCWLHDCVLELNLRKSAANTENSPNESPLQSRDFDEQILALRSMSSTGNWRKFNFFYYFHHKNYVSSRTYSALLKD